MLLSTTHHQHENGEGADGDDLLQESLESKDFKDIETFVELLVELRWVHNNNQWRGHNGVCGLLKWNGEKKGIEKSGEKSRWESNVKRGRKKPTYNVAYRP